MAVVYHIRDWDEHFENYKTRELKKLEFVLVPNKHDGDSYRSLLGHSRGVEVFGVWVLLLQIASKCSPRGTLIRDNGSPHTAETISRMTGAPKRSVEMAFSLLASDEIGWLEQVDSDAEVFSPSQAEKKRAHGRVNRLITSDRPVMTPLGQISERPNACQWCSSEEKKAARGQPGIVAHHPIGYGNEISDTTVIFVCRSCHGFFESGKLTTADIIHRHGSSWIRSSEDGESCAAGDKSCADTTHHRAFFLERKGKEQKGREWKGTEHIEPTPSDVVFSHYRKFHPHARLGEPDRKRIAARLREGFTVEQLQSAIDGCHKSPFHCGENERQRKYQTLDLIFRDSSKVNQFIELNAIPPPVLSEKTQRSIRGADEWLQERLEGDHAVPGE